MHAVSDIEGRRKVGADPAPYLTSGGGEGIARMMKITAFATTAPHITFTTALGHHHLHLFRPILAEIATRTALSMNVFICATKDVIVNKDKV